MTKIYGINYDYIIVEEDGVILEKIDTRNNDIQIHFSDGTVIDIKYSVKKHKVWTMEIVEEGYSQYEIEEYDKEYSSHPSDELCIDAEYVDYKIVS